MRLLPDGFDSVDELYADDQLGQLIVSVEAAPTVLCRLGEFEDHGEGCESRMAVMAAAWFVEFMQRLPWLLHVD